MNYTACTIKYTLLQFLPPRKLLTTEEISYYGRDEQYTIITMIVSRYPTHAFPELMQLRTTAVLAGW